MPDLIPYALTLLATLAGGWALYKWGSATGNAKAEKAEDELKTEQAEHQADVAKLAAVNAARDKAITDTRNDNLSGKLQSHYID